MNTFIPDAWYAIAKASEVGRELLSRRVLDQQLVIYRTQSGEAVVLRDRCAHRFAPLSMGQLHGDCVACPYHGMQYGPDGRCVHVPGQPRIPEAAVVRSFPTLERFGLVFAWFGAPEHADPDELVQVEQYGVRGWGVSRGYSLFGASWENILDNLADPAHTSFVHQRTIGDAAGNDVPITTHEVNGTVVSGRWVNDSAPVPIVARYTSLSAPVDRWQFYYLRPPCTSWVDFGSIKSGSLCTPQDQANAPYRVLSYAFLTPCTAHSTHYFSFQLRSFSSEDDLVTAEMEDLYRLTFEEDKAILEAIQREEDACPGLVPVRIASDAGLVRVRRLIAKAGAML